MAKEKACKNCRMVYEGPKCPGCGSNENVDTFKGKVYILIPEESEIAGKLNNKKKGVFAVKLR
jgi:RNA polymerase subunit RPABC4/transcription elongation factor Spt4